MPSTISAQHNGRDALTCGNPTPDDVIEVGLLLPARRVQALVDLSRSRRQSVAQLLRTLIERELAAGVR